MAARYRPSTRKAVEVILFLAEKRNPIDFYRILKVIFYADKQHLNKYGRPIVGDVYRAMNHGPVAKTVYDVLRQDALEMQAYDACAEEANQSPPFEVCDRYWVRPRRKANRLLLSKSDVEALDWAFETYASLSFRELEKLTHAEPSWENAYASGEPMRYEDLLEDGPSKTEREDDLQETASTISF